MSGNVVDFFDNDFRELYAVSEKVDLYHEFHITKPTISRPTSVLKSPPTPQTHQPAVTSRFQVSLDDSKQVNLKVPAHKYHNPKYALVVGNSLGITGSLQDLTKLRDYTENNTKSNMEKLLHANRGADEPDRASPDDVRDGNNKDPKNPSPFGSKKQRSSFRLFLKGRSPGNSPDLKTVTQNHSSEPKQTSHSVPKPANHVREANPRLNNHTDEPPEVDNHVRDERPESPRVQNPKPAPVSPGHRIPDSDPVEELDDSFVIIEQPNVTKYKSKNSSKLPQRSVSMQAINTGQGQEDGELLTCDV